MINQAAVVIAAVLFAVLAVFFRRTLKKAEHPTWVLEKPPLPKDLASLVIRLDKWRSEGRLTLEDYERLMYLCQEDAAKLEPKNR